MPTPHLEALTIEPQQKAIASVIFMHGLGADGHDFAPVVPQFNQYSKLPIRYVFPHAPLRSVTLNAGYMMRAWYDIYGLEHDTVQDVKGITSAATAIEHLIAAELAKGIPTNKIVLAGFSQGGAIALHTGLRYPARLAGIIGLSTYLPVADHLANEAHTANKNTPIFLGHGDADPIIPLTWGNFTHQHLLDLHYSVSWHRYAMMPHSVCPQEIVDIGTWLHDVLSADS